MFLVGIVKRFCTFFQHTQRVTVDDSVLYRSKHWVDLSQSESHAQDSRHSCRCLPAQRHVGASQLVALTTILRTRIRKAVKPEKHAAIDLTQNVLQSSICRMLTVVPWRTGLEPCVATTLELFRAYPVGATHQS
jgi:hypothetical protein